MVSESEEEDDEDLIKMVVCEKPKEQWDCESILSKSTLLATLYQMTLRG